MTSQISVNIGSSDALLLDGNKPLAEPKVFSGIQLKSNKREVLDTSIPKKA